MISEFNTPHPWCFQRLGSQQGFSVQLLVKFTNLWIYYDSWHREPARSQLTRNTTTSPQEKLPQQSNAEGLFFFTNSSSSDMYTPFEQCTLKLYHGQGPPTQLLRSMKGSRCWVDIWVAGSWLPLALAARGRRASLSRFKWLNGVLATHRCFDQPLSACVS